MLISIFLYFNSRNFFSIIFTISKTVEACSSVDRASDSDSESQGFDSLHAYNQLLGLFWFRHL